jgi:hypothetical protein
MRAREQSLSTRADKPEMLDKGAQREISERLSGVEPMRRAQRASNVLLSRSGCNGEELSPAPRTLITQESELSRGASTGGRLLTCADATARRRHRHIRAPHSLLLCRPRVDNPAERSAMFNAHRAARKASDAIGAVRWPSRWAGCHWRQRPVPCSGAGWRQSRTVGASASNDRADPVRSNEHICLRDASVHGLVR